MYTLKYVINKTRSYGSAFFYLEDNRMVVILVQL